MERQVADRELMHDEVRRLNVLARRRGVPAATTEVASRVLGAVMWLDERYGSRTTYEFLQSLADTVVEHGGDGERLKVG
jgi:hypothetical protein